MTLQGYISFSLRRAIAAKPAGLDQNEAKTLSGISPLDYMNWNVYRCDSRESGHIAPIVYISK
ncbi:hypothetical protein [Desulfopila inferna]|uniref:hypothetical protein n=1 Tax=Desulfopila inferna TaxID=468528 RepID=UPI001962F418|nr:hypothetical protein [Desulfopila inferna]MBM9604687.1 hypothetical protein [Desulfopila inferna]